MTDNINPSNNSDPSTNCERLPPRWRWLHPSHKDIEIYRECLQQLSRIVAESKTCPDKSFLSKFTCDYCKSIINPQEEPHAWGCLVDDIISKENDYILNSIVVFPVCIACVAEQSITVG